MAAEVGEYGNDDDMAVTAEAKLDVQSIRDDFPYLEEPKNGKPVAFLDSAASAQKPRVVLETMSRFYEYRTQTCTAASTGSPSARPRRSRRAGEARAF